MSAASAAAHASASAPAPIPAAARIKTDRGVVRDRARIEDVVAKVKAAAREAGLSQAIAEPVWRTLIDRCIAYEFGVWDRMREEG